LLGKEIATNQFVTIKQNQAKWKLAGKELQLIFPQAGYPDFVNKTIIERVSNSPDGKPRFWFKNDDNSICCLFIKE